MPLTLSGSALGLGKVLQIVTATYAVQTTNNTSTYADTGLSATITPSSTSSKIFVIVNLSGLQKSGANSGSGVNAKLLRGATDLIVFANQDGYDGTTTTNSIGGAGCNYLDSPATTTATTYKVQFANTANAAGVLVQWNNSTSSIALIEVAP